MNSSIFWRLVWKEYRLQRALWLAMMVLTVLLILMLHAILPSREGKATLLYLIAIAFPALYASGCGATLFAGEHEADTYEFQRSLPVHSLSVFIGKIILALVSVVVMLGVSVGLATFLSESLYLALSPDPWRAMAWWTFGFFGLEMFLWTTLFSLLSKRVLVAAVLGIAAASVSVHFAAASITWQIVMETYCEAMPWRAAIAALVALADVGLAARWFRERRQRRSRSSRVTVDADGIGHPAASSERLPRTATLLRFVCSSRAIVDANGIARPAAFSEHLCGPDRTTILFRLVWQHWRQSCRTSMAILGAMLVPLMVIVVRSLESGSWGRLYFASSNDPVLYQFGVLPLLAMVPLLGLCVFLSDHREGRLRLLSNCGVPPKYVWLSRQSVLLPLSILTIPVFLLLAIFFAWGAYLFAWGAHLPGHHEYFLYYGAACAVAFGYMVLGIAAGQLCSMFIRSAILAAIFSILLTGVLAGWCWLMLFWHVNMLWSILPIPAALLLATRLHAADWLLERNGPRTWLRPGLALLVPTVALSIAVPLYRVNQIPVMGPDISFGEYQGTATPEERATLDLYRQAIAKYWRGDRGAQEAVASIVKASRQKLVHPIEGQSPLGEVLHWLVPNAEYEEEKGNLDAALEQYLAAIRITGQMRQCDWCGGEWPFVDGYEADIYRRLASWAARPKQTPERIMAAERQLREVAPRLSPVDAAMMQYAVLRRAINGDLSMMNFADKRVVRHIDLTTMLWLSLPWERTRAVRLLNLQTRLIFQIARASEGGADVDPNPIDNASLHLMFLAQAGLAPLRDSELLNTLRRSMDMPPISSDRENEGAPYRRARLSDSYRAIETARRAAHVVLALEAWKLKHGSLPKSLDELVGSYLDRVPTDPYSGMPFRYFRDGMKIPLHWSQELLEWQMCPTRGDIPSNKPFIWSTGTKVGIGYPVSDDVLEQYYLRRDWPDVNGRIRPSGIHKADSEFEIWQAGWPFPIP